MSEPSPMLSVRGLSVTFVRHDSSGALSRITVLRDVNLSVAPGEVVAIVGESGAGKSILAHAILGLLPDNAEVLGEVRLHDEPLTKERLIRIRGRALALVPQSVAYLDPTLTAGRAVRLAARRCGMSRSEALEAQSRAFARLGLGMPVANAYPCELSGGMARRVLLAMALVADAQLLIADEPTPGLDPETLEGSVRQLRFLADEGRAVLLITHEINAALGIADRVAVLLGGAIAEIAPVAAFSGTGQALEHPYSRALWNALPCNAFVASPIPAQGTVEPLNPGSDPASVPEVLPSACSAGQHA